MVQEVDLREENGGVAAVVQKFLLGEQPTDFGAIEK
jgi:hypothetical protein